MTPLLRTNGISVKFGGLVAVNAVDIAIPEGVIHGVIGPNGAGKTTFFNAITGLAGLSTGSIDFAGDNITRQPPFQRRVSACVAHSSRCSSFRSSRCWKTC